MSLFKVIIFLSIVSTIVVNSRALRKRRQEARSSAYYGTNGLGIYPYINYALSMAGLGNSMYPVGNNWYMPGNPAYPYSNQFGYGMQQQPYMSYYNSPTSYNTYGTPQYGGSGQYLQYSNNNQFYSGQSYMPTSNEWLPLPGYNRRRRRRQLLRSDMAPNLDNNLALSKSK